MSIHQIFGGSFQDAGGNVLANGSITFQLSSPAMVSGTGQIVQAVVQTFTLNTSGSVPASTPLWGNDQLTPSGTYYIVRIFNTAGALVRGPENWIITGASPIDLGTITASSPSVSYPGAVLLSPSGTQTITAGGLTLASGNVTAPVVNATTGLEINGAATSGHYPRGNGTNYVDSAILNADLPAAISVKNIESIRFADQFSGADLGAKINAAFTDLSGTPGEVWVNQNAGLTLSTAVTVPANSTLRFIQGGTYTLSAVITVNDGATVLGAAQGMQGTHTTLKAANSAALTMLITVPGNTAAVRAITLDGNQANSGTTGGTGSTALLVLSGLGGRQDITNVTVQNSSGDGMYISGAASGIKIDRLFAFQNNGDGLLAKSQSDIFIISSEFENNLLSGVELNGSSGDRIEHCDFGGNGSTGQAALYIHGTASLQSANTIVIGNQFGNNYNSDIKIVGYDTGTAGVSAQQQTIVGNQFIGSPNRPDATYPIIDIVDGQSNNITGNYTSSNGTGHRATCAVSYTETTPGRQAQSTNVGNVFNGANYSTAIRIDSVTPLNIWVGNQEGGGYYGNSSTTLTANYNSGSAKLVIANQNTGAMFRIDGVEAINRAATTSSTMPSLVLSWTDPGGIARTQTLVATSSANTTATQTSFSFVFQTNTATATLTSASYASSGATTMQYSLVYLITRLQ